MIKQNYSINEILREINDNGFYAIDSALTDDFIKLINKEVGNLEFSFNKNIAPSVIWKNQRYLTHHLCRSKAIFDFMTSNFVMSILIGYFKDKFRITDQRVYVTGRSEKMQWHVDNKLDTSEQTNYPGLIFIVYLSDVLDGYFQLIKNSHQWSRKSHADFSNSYIEKNHKHEIIDFKYPKGSIIIYLTELIHRAKQIKKLKFERCSLFFQVERKELGGEPILVNTSFLNDLTDEKMYYLGFGAESQYEIFPNTSINTIPPMKLLKIAGKSLIAALKAFPKNLIWKLNPDTRAYLKSFVDKS